MRVMQTHTRIGVLRGGPSGEYDVSLKTGSSVLKNMPAPFEALDIYIDREGMWHRNGRPVELGDIHKYVDAVFIALHGDYGEDGHAQRELERIGMPFVGSGSLGSALGMHKIRAKSIVGGHGLCMPRHREVPADEPADAAARAIFEAFLFPIIVKPVAGGSSLGVKKIDAFPGLAEAIGEAQEKYGNVMVEEYIAGKEATVGVVESFRGKKLYALPSVEIRLAEGSTFFDFDAKYSGQSEEICPGNFSSQEKQALEEAAPLAHEALGLAHYSRSDFIVSPKGKIYFLEVNTLPGLTEESLFPKALDAVGSSLPEFLKHVIGLSKLR